MIKGLTISSAPPLRKLTTLRVGGVPLGRVVVDEPHGFDALPSALERLGGRPVVLGNGSNILAGDGELPLVLVELGSAFTSSQPEIIEENAEAVTLRVGAATPLQLFLNRLAAMGLGGLEGLAGIPGQIGGAVAMNAGSYGDTIGNCLSAVQVFSPFSGSKIFRAGEFELGYRHFALSGLKKSKRKWFVIQSAEFTLPRRSPEEARARMRECMERKKATQPVSAASAGCVFKNPEDAPAGKLLEEAGLKGYGRGGMSFSTLHANFMVNDGSGTATQAFELIDEASHLVMERSGTKLELEVRVWP